MQKIVVLCLVWMATLVPPLQTQAVEIPTYSCRNGLFASHSADHHFQLGRIQGKDRAYFYQDSEGCPTGKNCKSSSYVIPGDRVIINQIQTDWACVWYQGVKSETVGWVPRAQIKLDPPTRIPQYTEWLGHWAYSKSASISITAAVKSKNKQALALDGQAFWFGLVVNGEQVIHMGALATPELIPDDNRLYYSEDRQEYSCQAEFLLLPPYLIVDDNLNCGGQNVSFRGVYTRSSQAFKNTVRGD